MYLATYGVCRVYLLYWILGVYGSHVGYTATETFKQLRLPCQLGTATIGLTNTMWLVGGLRKFFLRHIRGDLAKKGV